MCYSSGFLNTCYYLDISGRDSDCADSDYLTNSELCYECLDSDKCYNCNFCRDCVNCTDCEHCYECRGCTNCFGCVGLRKKEFQIFNKQYSKAEYKKEISKIKETGLDEIYAKVEKLRENFTHPALHISNSENTFGDYIIGSKNCYMGFNIEKCQDCAYLYDEIVNLKDCYDSTHTTNCELCYGLMSADKCYNVNNSWWIVDCRDCEYGFCNLGCNNCFGCVNMKRREYCILNQQYTKDEYIKKVAEIKENLKKQGLYGKFLLMDAVELTKTL